MGGEFGGKWGELGSLQWAVFSWQFRKVGGWGRLYEE